MKTLNVNMTKAGPTNDQMYLSLSQHNSGCRYLISIDWLSLITATTKVINAIIPGNPYPNMYKGRIL